MITVYSINYYTDKSDYIADCGFFPNGDDFKLERDSCEGRYCRSLSVSC